MPPIELHDLTSSPEQATGPKKKARKRKRDAPAEDAAPQNVTERPKKGKPVKERRVDSLGRYDGHPAVSTGCAPKFVGCNLSVAHRRAVYRKGASTAVMERIARTQPGQASS